MSTFLIFLFTNNSPKLMLLLTGFKQRVVGWSRSPLAFLRALWGYLQISLQVFFMMKFEEGFLLNPCFWEVSEAESSLPWDNQPVVLVGV